MAKPKKIQDKSKPETKEKKSFEVGEKVKSRAEKIEKDFSEHAKFAKFKGEK